MRQALVILVACVACGIDRTVLVGAEPAPGVVGGPGIVVVPDAATFPNDAFAVFAGQQYSCALLGGRGWCWGRNNFGALGTGDTILRTTPTPVSGSTSFDTLALGENHTCGIEHGTGRVWCWGYGARGQLGLGTKDSALAPSPVPLPAPAVRLTTGYEHACAILATGALHCWGANGEGQLGL